MEVNQPTPPLPLPIMRGVNTKDVKIVIPSHKRHDRVKTLSAVAGAVLCVAESQADLYARCNKNVEIITHPDSVVGLARKRDWIIKYVGDVFMLDDDISHLGRIYSEKGESTLVTPEVAYELVQATAWATRRAGAYLYGFSSSPTPISYNSLNPIQLSGYVTGCAHGVLKGSKLWYNADIICNEDYWISLLNAHYHRKIYKDTRFYWHQGETFVNRGGLAEFRNIEAEKRDYELLRRVFGEAIQQTSHRRQYAKHEFQKTMKLPF